MMYGEVGDSRASGQQSSAIGPLRLTPSHTPTLTLTRALAAREAAAGW